MAVLNKQAKISLQKGTVQGQMRYRNFIYDIQPHQSKFGGFKPHIGHLVFKVHLMFSNVIVVHIKPHLFLSGEINWIFSFVHFFLISYGNLIENAKKLISTSKLSAKHQFTRFTTWVGGKAVIRTTERSQNFIDTRKKKKKKKLFCN